ncbi:MAG: hypothetical protein ACRCW0_06915 [Clostridium sp.]
MPKIGTRRTRKFYNDATEIANMISFTGAIIGGGAVAGGAAAKLSAALASKMGIFGGLGVSVGTQTLNLLTNKKLSQYRVEFTVTEVYSKERIFDTHEWVDAYVWKHAGTKVRLIKK